MSYASARYQVDKIFAFPAAADLTVAADVGAIQFTETTELVNFGVTLTEAVAADVTLPVVEVQDSGGVTLASITLADLEAAGSIDEVAVSTVTSPGDPLTFVVSTAAADGTAAAGTGYLYVNYKERFVV